MSIETNPREWRPSDTHDLMLDIAKRIAKNFWVDAERRMYRQVHSCTITMKLPLPTDGDAS